VHWIFHLRLQKKTESNSHRDGRKRRKKKKKKEGEVFLQSRGVYSCERVNTKRGERGGGGEGRGGERTVISFKVETA